MRFLVYSKNAVNVRYSFILHVCYANATVQGSRNSLVSNTDQRTPVTVELPFKWDEYGSISVYTYNKKCVGWAEELIGNMLCLYYWAPSLRLRSFLFTGCDSINMQACLNVGTPGFLSFESSEEKGRQWPLDGRPRFPRMPGAEGAR